MASWPSEWVAEYNLFKACDDEGARRQRWDTWPPRLRTAVYNITGTKGRPLLKRWKQDDIASEARMTAAEARASQASQSQHPTPAPNQAAAIQPKNDEPETHSWMEGTRIGEATNPGPGTQTHKRTKHDTTRQDHQRHLSGNHAPGWSSKHPRAQAGQHGARAVPQAPAGEHAKGNRPGPNPSVDRRGNRPGGNGGRNRNPAAMRNLRMSSVETVQRTPEGPRGGQEQWLTVRSREWVRLHKQITEMANVLSKMTEKLDHMHTRAQKPQQRQPQQRADNNPWSPLERGAANSNHNSIGLSNRSRNDHPENAGKRAGEWSNKPNGSRTSSPLLPFRRCSSAASATASTYESNTSEEPEHTVQGKASWRSLLRSPTPASRGETTRSSANVHKRAQPRTNQNAQQRKRYSRTRGSTPPRPRQAHRSRTRSRSATPPPNYRDALRLPSSSEKTTPRGKGRAHASNSGHPTTGGTSFRSSISNIPSTADKRTLPVPLHGKKARSVHASTGRQAWTWASWKEWLAVANTRKNWRKAPVRQMLQTRQREAALRHDKANYYSAEMISTHHGLIYAAFHCPTGKFYVGQTINTIQARAQDHWYARRKATDYFHTALADDADPMTLVFFCAGACTKKRMDGTRAPNAGMEGTQAYPFQSSGNATGAFLGRPPMYNVAERVEFSVPGKASSILAKAPEGPRATNR